ERRRCRPADRPNGAGRRQRRYDQKIAVVQATARVGLSHHCRMVHAQTPRSWPSAGDLQKYAGTTFEKRYEGAFGTVHVASRWIFFDLSVHTSCTRRLLTN